MNPKTKLQKQVVELSTKLPPVSEEQAKWSQRLFFSYFAESRKSFYCLECGHKWRPNTGYHSPHIIKKCTCPSCHNELKRIDYKAAHYKKISYMAIVSVVGEFQVVRTVMISKYMKKKQAPEFSEMEVAQKWMLGSGKTTTIAMLRSGFGNNWSDGWVIGSDLFLRGAGYFDGRYSVAPDGVYPGAKVLPIFKRNGFKSSFHRISPHELLYNLVTSPRIETLMKAGQFALIRSGRTALINEYWKPIKICIRNGYIIKDPSMYFDYLDFLKGYGKDLQNRKFVCPENLKQAHDVLMNKRERELAIERRQRQAEDAVLRAKRDEERRIRLETAAARYTESKGHFFDLKFVEGDLTVSVLTTVDEFREEGEELNHCVYVNEYHEKKDSLVLSAKIDGVRVETVEILLGQMRISQSRGLHNNQTEHHHRIVDLVNRNMKFIRRIHTKARKQSTIKTNLNSFLHEQRNEAH